MNLSLPLAQNGVKILGTSPDAIDRAEDRKLFKELADKVGIKQPKSDTALSVEEAERIVEKIGYPVLIRPSYVLGGRAMAVVWNPADLRGFLKEAFVVSGDHPVLIDEFLEDAVEVDVDAVSDGQDVIVGGVMEHIEQAGIHSGDSAMVLPAYSLHNETVTAIKEQTRHIARELGINGLINIQYAVRENDIYILEVNPRASRTIPFVSKATGLPFAKIATRIMAGISLKEQGITNDPMPTYFSVKESVLPFIRFPGVDTILGPEMKSTGEVMGIDPDIGFAFAKSQIAAGQILPDSGKVFLSVKDSDKLSIIALGRKFEEMGFEIISTPGTAQALMDQGISVASLPKLAEGRPNILDYIKNRNVNLLINTPSGPIPRRDEITIRSIAVAYGIPLVTTIAGAVAMENAIRSLREGCCNIRSLQEIYASQIGGGQF